MPQVDATNDRPATCSVCAVIVTYRPDPGGLVPEIRALAPQVDKIVVVANAPSDTLPALAGVEVLRQSANIGLAAAQNVGISWARRHRHTHVLLLDQDSLPAPEMVDRLLAAESRLRRDGVRIGAVGPRFRDERENRDAPFVKIAFPMSRKLACSSATDLVETDFLISSGCLIPLSVLDHVGDMDDGLFIDNVDMEWCFRARSRGYSLVGVCAATMSHRLGDDRVQLPGGHRQVIHSPLRLYYIMRNRVVLYRLRHTPRVWVAQDVPRVVVKFLIFSLIVGPRGRNVRFMLRGLADGLRGRSGPCPWGVES